MGAKKLIIVGAGGFGSEAAWVAESMNEKSPASKPWQILGYADDDPAKVGSRLYGYPVLGSASEVAAKWRGEKIWFYCAIGCNETRGKTAAALARLGWQAATLIHPSVICANDVEIGAGSYVGAYSILNPKAVIGRHVLINQRVAVGHDAVLGDFSQACPGAQLNGNVQIGRGAFIGSNASIHQGKRVGEWATVGANSQVIMAVKDRQTVCGVPARVLMSKGS